MRWTPHVTVACIVEDQGRYLLVEEWSGGKRVLNQPAGHLEDGETFVQGTLREVMEETAWKVEVTDFLGLYIYTSPHNSTTYHRHCFIARPVEHHPERPLDEGIERALWLTLEQIRAEQPRLRSPMVLQAIEDYLAGQRYPLDLIHDRDPIPAA